ncbi:MAG: hypothetical protein ACYTHM_22655 [Planctomycetota bacterium]
MQCAYKVPRVKSPWNRIPKALQSICLKAMAGRKEARYPSVEAVVEDVRAFLDHRPVKAHRSGWGTRLLRFTQRHPAGSLAGGVALILLLLGSALTGVLLQRAEAERAKASEKEAVADAERARAEAAAVRAQLAEEARAKAEVRASDAEDALRKGRLVSAVLRSADVELAGVLRDLKKLYYSSLLTFEEKERLGEAYWPKIAAFERTVPGDSASQAAWLAAKGWLRRYMFQGKKAKALFQESRKADPDIAYGSLFEAMYSMCLYLGYQTWPTLITRAGEIDFGPMPKESKAMREAKTAFEKALAATERMPVWGETSSRDFREVLEGFKAIQEGDLETAERGLTKGLSVPEMVWLREELWMARAKVRYFRKAFAGALEDVQKFREACPESYDACHYEGVIWQAIGILDAFSGGKEYAEAFRKSIGCLEKIRGSPVSGPETLNYLGMTWEGFGDALMFRKGDPREAFQMAIQVYSEFIRQCSRHPYGYNNRANALTKLGRCLKWSTGGGKECFRKAIADCDEAIRLKPDYASAFNIRGFGYFNLSKFRGENRRVCCEKAVRDLGEAFRLDPGNLTALLNRATAWLSIAQDLRLQGKDFETPSRNAFQDAETARRLSRNGFRALELKTLALGDLAMAFRAKGRDPRPLMQEALKEFEEAVNRDAPPPEAFIARAKMLTFLASDQQRQKEDPVPTYRRAIEDLTEALRRKPGHLRALGDRANASRDLAEFLATQGKDPREPMREVIKDCTHVLRIHPGDPGALALRGMAHRSIGEASRVFGGDPRPHFRQAIEDTTQSLGLDPNRKLSHYNRGLSHLGLGLLQAAAREDARASFRAAINDFSEVIRRLPWLHVKTYFKRAWAYKELGNAMKRKEEDPREVLRLAIRDYETAMKKGGLAYIGACNNIGNTYQELALAMGLRGEPGLPAAEKGLAAFDRMLREKPGAWEPLLNKAILLDYMGRCDDAVKTMTLAQKAYGKPHKGMEGFLAELGPIAAMAPWIKKIFRAGKIVRLGMALEGRALYEQALAEAKALGAPKNSDERELFQRVRRDLAIGYTFASTGRTSPLAEPKPLSEEEASKLREKAFENLRLALELGHEKFGEICHDPIFDPIRKFPQFQALVKAWEDRRKKEGEGK